MDLLERESHLAALARALAEARGGNGRLALVSGEAGIGKTSLVRHFTAEITPPTRLLWGACDALFTPRPLGPLYDIAPQVGPPLLAQLNEGSDWLTIARTFLANLERRTAVVVIEDVHWADEATLDLLKFLGRRIGQTNSLLILTFRNDELHPQHPLQILLGDLATTGLLQRIPLYGLSVDAVSTLSGDKGIDATSLHRQTNGNPFFVTEVLASEVASGVASDIPATVRDAVLARVARLAPPARAVLEAAAVIGARIEPWLLAEVTDAEATAAEACLAIGVLQTEGDKLAFRHDLARQVILDAISPSQKLALHRLILAALQASAHTQTDLARLAHHAVGANDAEAVLQHTPVAARQAAAANAHRQAAAHYRQALRFAGGLSDRERALLLEAYAAECATVDDLESAISAVQEVTRLWEKVGDRAKQSHNLSGLARFLVQSGQNAAAEEASQAAINVLAGLPPSWQLAQAYRTQASLRMLDRDCAEAISWGQKAMALAEQMQDKAMLARAYNVVGAAMLVGGDSQGRTYLEQSLSLAKEAENPNLIALAYGNLGSGLGEMHYFSLADYYLTKGIAYCAEQEIDNSRHYLLAWQALSHFYQGRWTEAAETANALLNQPQIASISRIMALAALGWVRVRRGDPGATAALDEALELASQTETLQRLAPVRAARAEAAWLAGDPERTLAEATAVFDLAVQKKHIWFTGELAFWRWRAGDTPSLPSWTAVPFARHIEGDWQTAAVEWKQLGCPYEQARALADGDAEAQLQALAIFEKLGARPAADALRQQMQAVGVRGIPRGPRSTTQQNPFGLTPRQMAVLVSLTEGLSNNEIAERLTISPRTVEHHLTAVFTKLNVNSRQEALALAWEHNLLADR
jgi:DNA-binding CsgD family transcriptional regulator/tetratricopeptide (TPR) repeat protein